MWRRVRERWWRQYGNCFPERMLNWTLPVNPKPLMLTPAAHRITRRHRLQGVVWHTVLMLVLLVGHCMRQLLVAVETQAAGQEQKASAQGKGEEPAKKKVVLPAETERVLRGFITKLAKAKRRLYNQDMTALAGKVAEETGLDAAAKGRLMQGFGEAVDAAMDGWEEKAYDWLAPYLNRSGQAAQREVARWPLEQIAKAPGVEGVLRPEEQPVWEALLQQTLTSAQREKWQARLEKEKQDLERRMREAVGFFADNHRPHLEEQAALAVADISNAVLLDARRKEALEKLSGDAVDGAMERWKAGVMVVLRRLEPERRNALLNQGGGMVMPEEEVLVTEEPAWTQGLAKLLTPEETTRLEAAREGRRQRRVAASRAALLEILDDQLALTRSQREALATPLQPMAEKLTEQMKRYYNLDPFTVGYVLRESDLAPLRSLLEEEQRADLERLLQPAPSGRRGAGDPEAVERAKVLPPPRTDAELEALLSADLTRRYEETVAERRAAMRRLVRDVDRHVDLSASQEAELELAAAGAVQDALEMFRHQLSTWLRQSLAGATADTMRARLASLGTAGFGNEMLPEQTPLWLGSLSRVLTEAQKKRWRETREAREAALRECQVMLVLSELDQQLALTPEQAAFFEKRLRGIIHEYAEDLDDYNGARRWHLHAYSMLTPVAGVPEEELKKQLTPPQLELWQEKASSQVKHYWDGVKRKHDARLRQEEEQKKQASERSGSGQAKGEPASQKEATP